MTENEAKLSADNAALKTKVANLETRISLLRSQSVMRKLYRARRDKELRERIAAIGAALEEALRS